jgi:ribonuclease PH
VERGRPGGRTQEIQRLIGRSLRGIVNLELLGPRTITVDCDVLQADGGTRTASITGAYVALELAIRKLASSVPSAPAAIQSQVAAVSVGIVKGVPMLDLCYEEDSTAEVDFNLVMTGDDALIEVQGTAEGKPFSRASMDQLLDLGRSGILELFALQRAALAPS